MSWRNKEDLGTQLVAHVHDSLRIGADYMLDNIARGFSWWAADYQQRIWSDLGNFHNATTLYRLHAEIDFLKGCGHAEAGQDELTRILGEGSLSALIYDPENDQYKLHCSIYAKNDNAAWVQRVFNAAVALQVCEVQRLSASLSKEFQMAPAVSAHPTRGMRKTPDQVCAFEESFFKPYGRGASRWLVSPEWEEARESLKRICKDVKTDYKLCLEATFDWPYGQRDIDLVVSAVDPHPVLGHGLLLTLTVPAMMDLHHKSQVAIALNEEERKTWNWCHDLGSWSCREGEIAFVCFVPNICHTVGILPELTHDMALRANWVSEHWHETVKAEWVTG